jgi:hypothetical protein
MAGKAAVLWVWRRLCDFVGAYRRFGVTCSEEDGTNVGKSTMSDAAGPSDPRTVFLFKNQPDTLIIPILFCYKSLRVSGIFSAHHQEFSAVHSALVGFMRV